MFKKIYIEITNICNLNCKFCPETSRKKRTMSLENFEEIIITRDLISKTYNANVLDFVNEEAQNIIDNYNKMIAHEEFDKDVLKYFIVENYLDKFISEEKDSFTTDRESAIMFGLPSILVEGIIVGRELENDKESLEYIKSIFKDVYICNLEGVVIL